jgi:hypothetical protein
MLTVATKVIKSDPPNLSAGIRDSFRCRVLGALSFPSERVMPALTGQCGSSGAVMVVMAGWRLAGPWRVAPSGSGDSVALVSGAVTMQFASR